jgi:hypothetical protein
MTSWVASSKEIALSASRFVSIALFVASVTTGCRPPRVTALPGEVAPSQRLPRGELPSGYRKVVFDWELKDGDMTARGEGVARIASPDSVRMDFFLGGGLGSGAAILIGDSLLVPGPDMIRKLVPPRPLLWAALGRLDLPAERDTVMRVDGAVLRADIGTPTHWRATFRGDTLARLERIADGRLREWVERSADRRVQYRSEETRRSLSLVIQRSDAVQGFSPSIWHF